MDYSASNHPRATLPRSTLYEICVLAVVLLFVVDGLPADAQTFSIIEDTLESSIAYDHPHNDVKVTCTFSPVSDPTATYQTRGFWMGKLAYGIRFAPDRPVEWIRSCSSTDPANEGLAGEIRFDVVEPDVLRGDLNQKGRLIAGDRYLQYGDGSPFFYLGDTAWEIAWKSRKEEVSAYLDDREEKGFTAIQVVVMSHQQLSDDGVSNRYGATYFLNQDYSMLNPEYFEYVDWLVEEINQRDMVAVLVPLWAYMNELYPETGPQREKLDRAESLGVANYLGARYSAHHVIWVVGGDNEYDTEERRSFWSDFAEELDAASGRNHLITVHPLGYSASFDFFDASYDWIDFHSFQSSHVAEDIYPSITARRGYGIEPAKPILNMEPAYEDIFNRFWEPGDTTSANTFRIRPEHVREASYGSVLSGALVGISYGANGVWQWSTDEFPGSHQPRVRVEEAIGFPGSGSMTILKELLISLNWHDMKPYPGLARRKGRRDFVPAAAGPDYVVAYFPARLTKTELFLSELAEDIAYHWVNPQDGSVHPGATATGPETLSALTVTPPGPVDFLWVGEIRSPPLAESEPPGGALSGGMSPSPFSGQTSARLTLPKDGLLTIEVFDLSGRRLISNQQHVAAGRFSIPASITTKGLLVYRISHQPDSGPGEVLVGSIISI